MRPMKWIYDRPLNTLVKQGHNYRADVPIKAGPATVVNTYPTPTMEIEYYTLQFGDAVDARAEDTGGAVDKVMEGWMKNVADLPKEVRPKFQDKLLIGEHHQATAVDLIHAGGDGGE